VCVTRLPPGAVFLPAVFHNLFNQDRHLISRDDYKTRRSAALAVWKTLAGQALHPPALPAFSGDELPLD
jgi:hypothetical protein